VTTEPETSFLGEISAVWSQAVDIWLSGGWAMWAIAVIALLMFGMGVHVHLALRSKGFLAVPESVWRVWIERPMEREGPIGELLDFVTGARTLEDAAISFEQLQVSEAAPFERDLKVMKVCVSAAPLVGLLGTVTGMLATFGALSSGSGGDKTMAMIADGISEALITTETGLVIALPGLFFQYQLNRGFQAYTAFLAHLESVCNQLLYRELKKSRAQNVRQLAKAELAARIRQARPTATT
jgi:biopolymer transport protein ExbB